MQQLADRLKAFADAAERQRRFHEARAMRDAAYSLLRMERANERLRERLGEANGRVKYVPPHLKLMAEVFQQ